MTGQPQPGILAELPAHGRYLFWRLAKPALAKVALQRLRVLVNGRTSVVGVGLSLVDSLSAQVPGLCAFPSLPDPRAPGHTLPADATALWCWLRSDAGEDQGHLLHRNQRLEAVLSPAFKLVRVTDGFCHARQALAADGKTGLGHGRDLTGYEDGTENPQGKKARLTAVVAGQGVGLDGGSFVAVQQWQHDFKAFERMSAQARDHAIGRRQSDNEELDDAPESAHVKRTAQENFSPEAFVLRRSMPWVQGRQAGLMFVAFGHSLDAFEAQMRRMAGLDDGIADALFTLSRPTSGAYFWCPPLRGSGQRRSLDLRQLGVD